MLKLDVCYLILIVVCHSIHYTTPYESQEVLSELKRLKELIEKRSYVKKRQSCRELTFNDLMLKYKSETGNNNGVVAATVRDAVWFPNLLWDVNKQKKYLFLIKNLTRLFGEVENSSDPNVMLQFKNLVAKKLNLTQTNSTGIPGDTRLRQSGRISKRLACTNPGYLDPNTQNLNLCGQCSETTTMDYDR